MPQDTPLDNPTCADIEDMDLRGGPGQRGYPSHLAIGRILGPWGLRGQAKVEILTDFPTRFSTLTSVYIGDELEPAEIESFQLHKGFAILKFRGVDQRDDIESLRRKLVRIRAEDAMPLEDGAYYIHQIVGLDVWTSEGDYLGIIDDILFTGSNDVYVVKNQGEEILIPAISQVIREVDINNGRVTVHLMEGLR